MFFVSENNYVVISDPESSECSHGLVYKRSSFIGFSFEMFPNIVFIGVYIKPEGSKYFDQCMFAELCAYVLDCHERNKIVYLGGDFNSRPGDFNCIMHENSWKYSNNVDKNCNSHGKKFFKDLCSTADVMPLNNMKNKKACMPGDFTYHKGDLKSQIDFILCDRDGLDFVDSFCVIQNN